MTILYLRDMRALLQSPRPSVPGLTNAQVYQTIYEASFRPYSEACEAGTAPNPGTPRRVPAAPLRDRLQRQPAVPGGVKSLGTKVCNMVVPDLKPFEEKENGADRVIRAD